MEYQNIFNKKFLEIMIFLVVGIISALFFLINYSYWDNYEFLRNNKAARVAYKLLIPAIVAMHVIMEVIPIVKDKPLIDANNYVVGHGVASQEVVSGVFGISNSIMVEIDGTECEYSVVGHYEKIKKGDKVKVTSLPHSKYAVIELE